MNELFQQKSVAWVAYGDFSAIKVHPEYAGPPPDGDDFVPFDGDRLQLDRKFDPALSHAFRCALLLGGVDFSNIKLLLKGTAGAKDAVTMNIGTFINNIISFLIVAWAVFLVVKAINSLRKKDEEAPAAPPASETYLKEIRDALVNKE